MAHQGIYCNSPCFFMGASTPNGFYGLFEDLYEPKKGWHLYIIRGGPGTGKSGMMKKIADKAEKSGLFCERVYCSSDPDSLDAVILPSLKISVADGTAPHILNEKYPGVSETLIDLGQFRNDTLLKQHRTEIIRLFSHYSELQDQSRGYLHAAGLILQENRLLVSEAFDEQRLHQFFERFIKKYFNAQASQNGAVSERFLSANTGKGTVTLLCTVFQLCEKQVLLNDFYALASKRFLTLLADFSISHGIKTVVCKNPMEPNAPQHLLFPELSLAVLSSNRFQPISVPDAIPVAMNRFYTPQSIADHKNRLTLLKKMYDEMLSLSKESLIKAKKTHDRLETVYGSAMDFNGVSRKTDWLIGEIFSNIPPM